MHNPFIIIGNRKIGLDYPPLGIAEIGINHEGSLENYCQDEPVEAKKLKSCGKLYEIW